jgi:hypothetical protein
VGWSRRVLVTAEVAVGVVLLVFAGLLVRTFVNLRSLDPGFEPQGVVAGTVSLQDARYETRERDRRPGGREPGAAPRHARGGGAAVSLGLPYQRLLNLGFRDAAAGRRQERLGGGLHQLRHAGLLRDPARSRSSEGRALEAADGRGGPKVAVVNQRLRGEYLPEGAGVGTRFEIGGGRELLRDRGRGGERAAEPPGLGGRDPLAPVPVVYVPLAQVDDETFVLVHTWFAPSWIVRSALPTEQAVAGIRQALQAADPRLPFVAFREMDEVRSEELGLQRFLMTLAVILAALAALLVALGLHGLVAHAVAERTRELGIRVALGSTLGQAVRVVLRPVAALTLAGVALGAGLALAGSRLVSAFVYGVSATDPLTLLAAATALLLVAATRQPGPRPEGPPPRPGPDAAGGVRRQVRARSSARPGALALPGTPAGRSARPGEGAEMERGQRIPALELPDESGTKRTSATSPGRGLVLYAYPKDDTPGCTIEAQDFRDHGDAFPPPASRSPASRWTTPARTAASATSTTSTSRC